MASKKSLKIILLSFFGFIVLLYIHNLSRSVYGGDVGDMVTAASVLGVAHPPGYPLFTLLGFILTRVHFISPAFMVGLISAVSGAISVIIFFLISLKITKNRGVAFISSLILAFSYLFWFYAEIADVFALNNLFILLLFYFALLFREKKDKKYFFVLALTAGLSLTNHQTILFVFPSVLILTYQNLFKFLKTPKVIIAGLLFFLLGLLVYAYIPFAALKNPPINWDHVHDLDSFLRLVLRRDYGTFSAGSFVQPILSQRLIILKTYFSDIFLQLTLPVVFLSLIGAVSLLIKDKKLFLSILLGFILSGPLFIAYAGFPLLNSFYVGIYERFFLMSSVLFLLFFPPGLLFFIKTINKVFKKTTYEPLFLGVFLIIPLSLFYYNFPKTDLSNVYIGDRLAYDIVSPLPKNSVLLLSGDTALFNVWYLRYGLNFRQDVQPVNINGLAGDVFFDKAQKEYLLLYPKDKNDKNLKLKVVAYLANKRPVFSYTSLALASKTKYTWVPYGLTFKLLIGKADTDSEASFIKEVDSVWSKFRKPTSLEVKSLALGSLTIADLPSVYSDALLATGNFLISEYKDEKLAFEFFKRALKISPNYHKNYEELGVYYLTQKDCVNARDALNKGIAIFPFEKISYYLLYLAYSDCLHDKKMQAKIIDDYKNIFKSDLLKDSKILINDIKNNK